MNVTTMYRQDVDIILGSPLMGIGDLHPKHEDDVIFIFMYQNDDDIVVHYNEVRFRISIITRP